LADGDAVLTANNTATGLLNMNEYKILDDLSSDVTLVDNELVDYDSKLDTDITLSHTNILDKLTT